MVCCVWRIIDIFRGLFAFCKLVNDELFLSETWFTHNSPRELNGYIEHHVTKRNGRGGCMSVFVSDAFNF